MSPEANSELRKNYQNLFISLTSAVILTHILFFIDEGYYDFRWMRSIGNWIVFLIYVVLLSIPQFVLLSVLQWLRGRIGFTIPESIHQFLIALLVLGGLIMGVIIAFALLG